ncbi:unnamed protein product [Somion occarium]|uniref:ubiquitinyl hydrolase 1 n=1 Tax=Somion occarium TaxID=3059160 RepID=A0ABP1CWM2_9APHY
MHLPEELIVLFTRFASHPVIQQIAPFVVLVLVPFLVLVGQAHIVSLFDSLSMALENLSFILPWNWSFGNASNSSGRRKPRNKLVRTRAEQIGLTGDAIGKNENGLEDGGYYPGIVNISGTYCFMDSTLQAMASLSYLLPYIEEIHSQAEALDVPTPVIDALRDIIHTLDRPQRSPYAIRPIEMIDALARHSQGKHNSLFSSREHQDAQELFQLISECIKTEAAAVDKESYRDRGLGGLSHGSPQTNRDLGKSVFDGLTANRRSCRECGYTEAVMHFAFDNWQLTVPRSSCHLQDCLSDYTRIEILEDCICRKCSMIFTYKKLEEEAERLTEAAGAHEASPSKKKRAREARKLAARVKAALDEGRIEEDIRGVKMEKVLSRESTKQAMIARPPPVLALHLNRSMHWGHYATKNTCHIFFPELLDLSPYTTSGKLSTIPDKPISEQGPFIPRSTTPTPATYAAPRVLYRLSAIVCHYGQHSFGHYVCYRRKPRPMSSGARRFAPPKLVCPLGCTCEKCQMYGPVRDEAEDGEEKLIPSRNVPGRGWLRISDESVQEVGLETVLREGSGAFMLYYERVLQPGVYISPSPRGSEETLKPKMNSSNASLHSVLTDGTKTDEAVEEKKSVPKVIGPRVVRNVSTQRSRSSSASPPNQPSVLSSGLPHPLASVQEDKTSRPLQNGVSSHTPPKAEASLPPIAPSPTKKAKTSPLQHNTPPTELHILSPTPTPSAREVGETSSNSRTSGLSISTNGRSSGVTP